MRTLLRRGRWHASSHEWSLCRSSWRLLDGTQPTLSGVPSGQGARVVQYTPADARCLSPAQPQLPLPSSVSRGQTASPARPKQRGGRKGVCCKSGSPLTSFNRPLPRRYTAAVAHGRYKHTCSCVCVLRWCTRNAAGAVQSFQLLHMPYSSAWSCPLPRAARPPGARAVQVTFRVPWCKPRG